MNGKYLVKTFNKFLGIDTPDFLINLLLCHGFTNKIEYIVILKCPKKKLVYYFPNGSRILERNSNHLKKIPNLEKQRIHSEGTHDSEYVMACHNIITSIYIQLYIIIILKPNIMIKKKT